MKKTIETIVMSAALTSMLGCDTSSSNTPISCSNQSTEYTLCYGRNETNCEIYSKSAECAKNGGTYNCSETTNEMNNNTYCACSHSYQTDNNLSPNKRWQNK